MSKLDIKSREDIFQLVTKFYEKVRKDKVLGPFFNETIKDWGAHLQHLTTFWESSLFLKTKFHGNPLEAHIKVDAAHNNSITELHFGLWLNLWFETIDELFEGDYAENAKRRARKMGTFLYLKILKQEILVINIVLLNFVIINFNYRRMGLLKEFKEFAVKGNMMDMAIGIIIGASFNKVIDVLVKKVLIPPLSLLTDGLNFADKKIVLRDAITEASGNVTSSEIAIGYGALIEVLIDFMVIGFTVFLAVKGMNKLRNKAQDSKDKTVATPKDIELLSDLKDLMEEQNKFLKANASK